MCQGNGNSTDTKPNESRNELFAASFHFKCRILAKSTKNPACTEIEAAVAEVLQFLAARFNATLRIQGVT